MARLPVIITFCFALVSQTNAFSLLDDAHLNTLLLQKRQAGDPSYDCHANCGYTIQGARQPNYCTNTTWTAWYEGCMQCAIATGIWSDYGDNVTNAAQACGLSALPVGLNGTANSTTSSLATPSPSLASASVVASSAGAAASSLASVAASASGSASSAAASATASASSQASSLTSAPLFGNSLAFTVGLVVTFGFWL